MGLIVMLLLSLTYLDPLFSTETGQMVTAAAAGSMGVGIFIMNKIATIRV